MKVIIMGLGNPILGDDGIGWRVAEEVEKVTQSKSFQLRTEERASIEIKNLAMGGLSLMEQLVDHDYAIIIDAFSIPGEEPGRIRIFDLEELEEYPGGHLTSSHDTTLQNALGMGKALGANLPDQVNIVGITAESVYEFSETLSAEVQEAIPEAVQAVIHLLLKKIHGE